MDGMLPEEKLKMQKLGNWNYKCREAKDKQPIGLNILEVHVLNIYDTAQVGHGLDLVRYICKGGYVLNMAAWEDMAEYGYGMGGWVEQEERKRGLQP